MSRILSGIRASGQIHLGVYLGAMKQWIALQDEHEVFYMVADLHGITTPYDPKELPQRVRDTVIDYLAAGLDPDKASLFVQSYVPAHSQLMWLLNTVTPFGELQRMVQFKEWSEKHALNAGILNYPILMAADILAYKPTIVPVGEDQEQHVELARDIAKKFNSLYGKTFSEPKSLVPAGTKRIMSLEDPEAKMSKSDGNGIGLNDSPEEIEKKLKKAVTSSEPRIVREAMHAAEYQSVPGAAADEKKTTDLLTKIDPNQLKQFHGVRNLFAILFSLGSPEDIARWKADAEEGTVQFSEFKPALANIIANHFAPFRDRRLKFEQDPAFVQGVIEAGNAKANIIAEKTLREVQEKMGLR